MSQKRNVNGISIITEPSQMKAFLNYPYALYKDEPNWVPPLYIQQRDLLDKKKNPYFKEADAEFFIAERNGKIAGRIAAIVNHTWVDYQKEQTGFFGFFECEDNPEIAQLLLNVASEWLKDKGMTKVIGPISPGMMYELGVLVEGHDKPNFIMMPWSKSYYDSLIKSCGFDKEIDLLAYMVTKETVAMDRIEKAEKIVRYRLPDIKIRPVNLKKFDEEVVTIRDIFNKAWATNWGFSPVGKEEFEHIAKDLKLIIDNDLAHIAEVNGEPIGFTVALPDLNSALIKVKRGRLLPFGIFKLLWHKRKIHKIRTALMGVIPEYRGKGVDALLHRESIIRGLAKGYDASELSWLLETNTEMIRVAEKIGGFKDKTYRIYGKALK
jgi:GNAT superfamily N-acetyltransferase